MMPARLASLVMAALIDSMSSISPTQTKMVSVS